MKIKPFIYNSAFLVAVITAAVVALFYSQVAINAMETRASIFRQACVDAGGTVVEYRKGLRCAKQFIPLVLPSIHQPDKPVRKSLEILT